LDFFDEILHNLTSLAAQTCIFNESSDENNCNSNNTTPEKSALSGTPLGGLFGLQRNITDASMQSGSSFAIGGSIDGMDNISTTLENETLLFNPSALSSALWSWHLFKTYYLSLLFPTVAEKIGIRCNQEKAFLTCPIPILESLVTFTIRHVLDPTVSGISTGAVPIETASKTTSFLQQLFLTDFEGREFLHEIIRQALLVPFANADLGRYAMFILRSWVFVPVSDSAFSSATFEATHQPFGTQHDDRPCFMRRQTRSKSLPSATPLNPSAPENTSTLNEEDPATSSLNASKDPTTSLLTTDTRNVRFVSTNLELESREWIANIFIRRYIRFLQCVFLDKKDYVDQVEAQVQLIKEALQFYRLLALETHIVLNNDTWDTLMATLATISNHVLCRPNKYAGVSSATHAEETCELLIETALYTWLRSGTKVDENWVLLKEIMEKCTRWMQAVQQWTVSNMKQLISTCFD
jgi:hypothetical protein